MANTTQFTNTGQLQFINKDSIIIVDAISNLLIDLTACNVITDVQELTFNIQKDSIVLAHFSIKNIVSWQTVDNIIVISSADELPITLTFINSIEAITADERIDNIMNGGNVTLC